MMEKRSIQAIDDAFDPSAIESFLQSLNVRWARSASMQEASSDLTTFIAGGPFRRGETFITSFWDVYQALDGTERGRVEAHYRSRVEAVPDKFRKKYPRAFRK